MKFLRTLKDVFLSSLPLVAVIVIVCGFVAKNTDPMYYVTLAIGYASVVIGQAIFLVGLDVSILPIGKMVGGSLIKLKKAVFIIFFGLLFGTVATVAEPALTVLAKQTNLIIEAVNETVFIWVMGAGIGIFVGFSLFRIMKNINIKIIFALMYAVIFIMLFIPGLVPEEFIALAFDGSGATTGDVSVPFILALGIGVSTTMSKSKTNDDVFGIIGLASIGPILSLFFYGMILKVTNGNVISINPDGYDPGSMGKIGEILLNNLLGVTLALAPIIIIFLPFQFLLLKLPKKEFLKILLGALTVFIGLYVFLVGIDYGFAAAAKDVGGIFIDPERDWLKWILLGVGFILGASITLSEPAVTVLGEQLEEITNGHIKKLTIRLTLAIGIGFAALLAIVKILTEINILWFLVPLYAVALIMMLFSSKLFVGLAFDSGGVAGGALTSAFLTPLTLGLAQAVAETSSSDATILTNGFGIIAFISVTPMIAVQFLGIIYELKMKKLKKKLEAEDLEGLTQLMDGDDEEQSSGAESESTITENGNGADSVITQPAQESLPDSDNLREVTE